ncbi:MAG: DUF2892 domain-containing protein [bacterium]
MSIENSIRLLAGSMVLMSLTLYWLVSPYWLLLTVFVGLNLVQSSFTHFCPAEMIFKRLFYSSGRQRADQRAERTSSF